jgi:hypothetical protein
MSGQGKVTVGGGGGCSLGYGDVGGSVASDAAFIGQLTVDFVSARVSCNVIASGG